MVKEYFSLEDYCDFFHKNYLFCSRLMLLFHLCNNDMAAVTSENHPGTQNSNQWGLSGSRTRDLSHPKRESYH